ncbi:MAG: threonine-phosphate decarboxylase CobD [Bacillota bacterium]
MQQEHGGNVREVSHLYGIKEEEIIDFSANINFLGPPPGLKQKLRAEIDAIVNYPEAGSGQLRDRLAEFEKVAPQNLLVGSGAAELIYEIIKAVSPEKVLLPEPSFSEYRKAAESFFCQIEELNLAPEDDFILRPGKVKERLGSVDLLFICNPHNPTGNLLTRKTVIEIIRAAQKEDVFVVVDEAFMDFVTESDCSVLDLVGDFANLFVLRSMTKFYAIPGLRLGYGVGPAGLVEKIARNRDPWTVNVLAQIAGEYILNKEAYRKKTLEAVDREKNFLEEQLSALEGIKPFPPACNFVFVDISETDFVAGVLVEKLARRGILVRNCDSFHGLQDDYIRLAVKSREDNLTLLDNLRKIMFNN